MIGTLSHHPKLLALSRSTPQGRADDEQSFIYVAGADASGSQDSFLVPEKTLNDPVSREAVIADQQFTIHFNRVRRKGRGWVLVGFEISATQRRFEIACCISRAGQLAHGRSHRTSGDTSGNTTDLDRTENLRSATTITRAFRPQIVERHQWISESDTWTSFARASSMSSTSRMTFG